MSAICILTDSTAQFTKPSFPGRDLVDIIPLDSAITHDVQTNGKEIKASNLPGSVPEGVTPQVILPTVADLRKKFLTAGQSYNEVIAILTSNQLNQLVDRALEAAETVRGKVYVQVIDSQSTSVGLGYLVQQAAEAAAGGARSTDIERLLRGIIPHVYGVFCIPGLTYLYHAGFIGEAQALVGEMLDLLPIYTLEDGHLTSIEKARNYRQLMDFFQEFLDEFSDLAHIAFIQSIPPLVHEARALREHAATLFPKTPFSEHSISLPLALLFGPHTIGLFAIESIEG